MPVDRQGGEARSGKRPESVRTGEGETLGERAERLGGEARNREAEVEAVARAILAANRGIEVPFEEAEEFVREWCRRSAAAAIAALDAVRCAQGRDTDTPEPCPEKRCEGCGARGREQCVNLPACVAARSPQGEDHEAGVQAAERAVIASARSRGWRGNDLEAWSLKADARAAVEGYLSRCLAHREDHEALIARLRDGIEHKNQRIVALNRRIYELEHPLLASGTEPDTGRQSPGADDLGLRDRIADELARNDECGSRHPLSRAEYLADADAILRIVGEHGPQGEDHEAGIEAAAAEILNGYERGGTAGGVAKRAIAAYLSRCPSPERDQSARLVAGIQWVRGMCSDEEPYEVIDATLAELLDGASGGGKGGET